MSLVENLERMLASGQDSAILRFGLGNGYLQQGQAEKALQHLQMALKQDPAYSAAWKLLGRAHTELGQLDQARDSYRRGMEVAEVRGDKQTAREMGVFLRRLQRSENP
jgi:Tfp pilus assembly protein PilF